MVTEINLRFVESDEQQLSSSIMTWSLTGTQSQSGNLPDSVGS